MKPDSTREPIKLHCSCGRTYDITFEQLGDPNFKISCPSCGKTIIETDLWNEISLSNDELERILPAEHSDKVIDHPKSSVFKTEGEKDPRSISEKVRRAHLYIVEQLLDSAKSLIMRWEWNERTNDWEANIHYLALYIGEERFALPFSLEELVLDQGSEKWERMILNKINGFFQRTSVTPKVKSVIPFEVEQRNKISQKEELGKKQRLLTPTQIVKLVTSCLSLLVYTALFFGLPGVDTVWRGSLVLIPVLVVSILYGFWRGLVTALIFVPITILFFYLRRGFWIHSVKDLLIGFGIAITMSGIIGAIRDLAVKYRRLSNWRKTLIQRYPICEECGKIWISGDMGKAVTSYLDQNPEIRLPRGLCPDCMIKLNRNEVKEGK
jgi:hypothetical protein